MTASEMLNDTYDNETDAIEKAKCAAVLLKCTVKVKKVAKNATRYCIGRLVGTDGAKVTIYGHTFVKKESGWIEIT